MSTHKKEYIVTLVKGDDHDTFSHEMCQAEGTSTIPSRCVDIINHRVASKVNTHYSLTEQEANELMKDSRVQSVLLPIEKDPNSIIQLYGNQSGPFIKQNDYYGSNYTINATGGASSQNNIFGTPAYRLSGHLDYAKILHTYVPVTGASFNRDAFEREKGTVDQYNKAITGLPDMCYLRPVISGGPASGQPTSSTAYGFGMQTQAFSEFDEYRFSMDGTGVDIVVQDSGIQADHPEFHDENGVSRVQQINWYHTSAIGTVASAFTLSSKMPSAHYTDKHGHGTHVAGTIAGRTYGWAKNANIYVHKVEIGKTGTPGSECISFADSFDLIKLWHRNKPIDPNTGYKRPTVVNMSWGSSWYIRNGDGKPLGGASYVMAESPLSALQSLNDVSRSSAIPTSGAGFIPMTGTLAKGPLSAYYSSGIAQFKPATASDSEWRKFSTLNPGDYDDTSQQIGNWIWSLPVYNPKLLSNTRRITNIKFNGVMYYDTISGTGSHPTSTPPSVLSTALSSTNIISMPLSATYTQPEVIEGASGNVHWGGQNGGAWNKYPWAGITGFNNGQNEMFFISSITDFGVATFKHQHNNSDKNICSRFGYRADSLGGLPESADSLVIRPTPVASLRNNAYDQDVGEMIDEGIHVVIAAGNSERYIASPKHANWGNYIGAPPSALPSQPPLSSGILSSSSSSGNYFLHKPIYAGYDTQHYARGSSPGDRTTGGLQQRHINVGSLDDTTFNQHVMDSTVYKHQLSATPLSAGYRYEYEYGKGSYGQFVGPRGQGSRNLPHSANPSISGIIGGHYNLTTAGYGAIPYVSYTDMIDLISKPWLNLTRPNYRSGSSEPIKTTQSSLESGASFVQTSSILSGAKYVPSRFSNYGSGIDIYAFGENIQSSFPTEDCSLLHLAGGGATSAKHSYPPDTNFRIHKIAGTSMAAPQVAGVLALTLQAHPEYTPAEAKASLLNDAISGIVMNGCRGEGNYGVNTSNIRHYPWFNGDFTNRLDLVSSATVPFSETPQREEINSFLQGSTGTTQPVNTKATSSVLFLNNKYRNSKASSLDFINITTT